MCTVSIIHLLDSPHGGVRVVCNRDERDGRPVARPPLARRFGDRVSVMPVDPESDGTWIAVNDAGLLLFLMNYNPRTSQITFPPRPTVSRGAIIPTLLHLATVPQAMRAARRLDPRRHEPFRLFIMNRHRLWQVTSDGASLRFERSRVDTPLVFSSSGLGDDLVRRPRERLFAEMVAECPTPDAQDEFHAHAWPGRAEISVCMRRAGARTVSRTAIELGADTAKLTYQPLVATTCSPPPFSSTLYLEQANVPVGPELCGSSSR